MSNDGRALEQAAGIRLQRRLSDWADELERIAREQGAAPGVLERGEGIAQVMAALDRHAQQVQADIGALLADGDEPDADVARAGALLVAHLDQVGQRALEQLTRSAAGKASVGGLRNRLLNQVAQAKTRAQAHLGEIAARAQAGEARSRRTPTPDGADELDDRLPLRRRRGFDRDLVELTRAARTGGAPLALIMVDLDHFKRVNDEHGHPVGDEVLRVVAELIVKRCAGKGRAYRYGGEEIAVLLPNYSADEAQGLAERVRKDIAAQPISSRALTITASLGVASFPDHAGDETALLAAADAALYRAKHAGRDCVRAPEQP